MSTDYRIPGPVDVRMLEALPAAVTGGLLTAPRADAQRALVRLEDDDMPPGALRFVLAAVRAVVDAGERPTVPAVAAHAQREALLPASHLTHLGVLLVDLTAPEVCPLGVGELVRIPDLVNAAARRRVRELGQRVVQVAEECADADLREVAPELGRALWRAAQRIYVAEVTA